MKNKNVSIPEREFKPRNSLLTDMFKVDHFKSVRHLCISSLIWWFLSSTFSEIFGRQSARIVYEYCQMAFGQFHKVILIWMLLFGCTILVHPGLCLWAKIRNRFKPKSWVQKLWDYMFLSMFFVYYICFMLLLVLVRNYDLPMASSATLLSEHVRMLMKIHAFVRTSVPKLLLYKPHTETREHLPLFSNYIYFLFIPTLIYRESYPRTDRIQWSFVFLNVFEFCASLVYFSLIVVHYLIPEFRNYGLEYYTWQTLTISIFNTILPGSLLMVVGFYLLLHSWMNIWAELLQFADRQFYEDWWNGSTYSIYYRKWNLIVHDYLRTYIYKDMYEIVTPGNRFVAACTVFLASAIAHEYIMSFMLGFCYPILAILLISFGIIVYFIKLHNTKNFGNLFLWWSLTFGCGIQASVYAAEFYIRLNCPKDYSGISDYFIPRTWTCNKWSDDVLCTKPVAINKF